MQVAYIIGPYRSVKGEYIVKRNIQAAEEISVCLWKLGYAVICPHKNSAFLGGIVPEQVFLTGYLEILKRCDFAVTVKGWEKSIGSVQEVNFCRENKIPLYHSRGPFNSLDELVKDEFIKEEFKCVSNIT